MQIIFHIDLNAFFASAEISQNPQLVGKPIVVCRESRRSIITTASYEARKYGIHSAMPLFQAKKLCPQLITVPPHFALYKTLSQEFFQIISTFSKKLEVASIDECYVDMTEYIQEHHLQPYQVAQNIQKKVYNTLNLQCSIGIAPNKFLAKMASDMKKPMGITILTKRNFKEKLWHLPVGQMHGIGKKTVPKLEQHGIYTIGDLAKYENYEKIRTVFQNEKRRKPWITIRGTKNDIYARPAGSSRTRTFRIRRGTTPSAEAGASVSLRISPNTKGLRKALRAPAPKASNTISRPGAGSIGNCSPSPASIPSKGGRKKSWPAAGLYPLKSRTSSVPSTPAASTPSTSK